MDARLTADEFARGMTPREYLAQMTMNREHYERALTATTVTPEDRAVLDRLGRPSRVLVITEDWCGTSLAYVPFAMRLAEDAGLELRVFLRDEHPALMDQFLKRGLYRSIPVIAFFDDAMREVARFIEARPG